MVPVARMTRKSPPPERPIIQRDASSRSDSPPARTSPASVGATMLPGLPTRTYRQPAAGASWVTRRARNERGMSRWAMAQADTVMARYTARRISIRRLGRRGLPPGWATRDPGRPTVGRAGAVGSSAWLSVLDRKSGPDAGRGAPLGRKVNQTSGRPSLVSGPPDPSIFAEAPSWRQLDRDLRIERRGADLQASTVGTVRRDVHGRGSRGSSIVSIIPPPQWPAGCPGTGTGATPGAGGWRRIRK
jgi:hypothetical protein